MYPDDQGLKLWASSVQKASSFPIRLVVWVTWASSNKYSSTYNMGFGTPFDLFCIFVVAAFFVCSIMTTLIINWTSSNYCEF